MRHLKETEDYLYRNIPLAMHMGVRVLDYDGTTVRLSAPLQMNLNHSYTAFGGSLSTLGILAGWTLLWLKCGESGFQSSLLIQQSSTDFIQVAEADFEAVCGVQNISSWQKFTTMINRFGRARIKLEAEIYADKVRVAKHFGRYVAIRDS